jgi:hypothetical protein
VRFFRSAALVALLGLTGACGAVTDPLDVVPEKYVESATVGPDAAAVFGADDVDEAVRTLTDLALTEAFRAELLDPARRDHTRAEIVGDTFVEHLTPEAVQDWEALVDAALAGDQHAQDEVGVMRLFDVAEPSWTVPDGDPVVSQEISDVHVGVLPGEGPGDELLTVSFQHEAVLEFRGERGPLADGGSRVRLQVVKQMTCSLTRTRAPEPKWLIAAFDGDYEIGSITR